MFFSFFYFTRYFLPREEVVNNTEQMGATVFVWGGPPQSAGRSCSWSNPSKLRRRGVLGLSFEHFDPSLVTLSHQDKMPFFTRGLFRAFTNRYMRHIDPSLWRGAVWCVVKVPDSFLFAAGSRVYSVSVGACWFSLMLMLTCTGRERNEEVSVQVG